MGRKGKPPISEHFGAAASANVQQKLGFLDLAPALRPSAHAFLFLSTPNLGVISNATITMYEWPHPTTKLPMKFGSFFDTFLYRIRFGSIQQPLEWATNKWEGLRKKEEGRFKDGRS
jgi:hypothetical protein